MSDPLCFVLMPFGRKPGPGGAMIDFDAVYRELIRPAVEAARLVPIRADEEQVGGLIHKPMFERLILCEYAVADLTTANANVFYELGVRHAVKPATTVLMAAEGGAQLPFDVAPLRALLYTLGADGMPSRVDAQRESLTRLLCEARADLADSPVYQLVEGFPDVQHIKTDVFRERVEYSAEIKRELAAARRQGRAAIEAIEQRLGPLDRVEAGVLVDLFLSYREVKAWGDMIRLARDLPDPLRRTVLVQEQLAFALNRDGQGEEAERVLLELIAARGPSSETYGILGRVYKDRWEQALRAGERARAAGMLERAIDAYRKGFETDWRDAYPGINAVTLMTLRTPPDPAASELLPVVRYAVERKIAAGQPDYWDHATCVELAVLAQDETAARAALGRALAVLRAAWEAETTARNLRLIRETRAARDESLPWAQEIEDELVESARRLPSS